MGHGVVEKKRLVFGNKVWYGKRMVCLSVEMWYNGKEQFE